jgi:hypothetical protein
MTRLSRISKNPKVPARVRQAFELMLSDPVMTWQLAAAAAGITTHRFRRALRLPHVASWARAAHKERVDAICAANPERLRAIADGSENDMARVASIKMLEAMKETLDNPARTPMAPGAVPGFCIVIRHGDRDEIFDPLPPPQQPAMIDVTPIEEPRRPFQYEP